jgi:hypothetical protein
MRDALGLLAALRRELALQIGNAVFGFGVAPDDEIHCEKSTVKLWPLGA